MNEPGNIMIAPEDIRRIRKSYKQLYTHKFNNLYEIGHFIKKQTTTIDSI